MLHHLQLEYFVISEIKLDHSFLSAQFAIENYEIRARRDKDGPGGGLIEFVKRSIICKRVKQFETVICQSIVQKFPFSERNCFVWSSVGHPVLII